MCVATNLQVHTLLSQRHECPVPAKFSKTELNFFADKGLDSSYIPRRDLRRCNLVLCRKEDDQLISTVVTTNKEIKKRFRNRISIKRRKKT